MNKLHALRKAKGITLEQLSDETDISFSALSAYERGTRNPKINTIRTLAEYFGVSSDYLEGRYETNKRKPSMKDLNRILNYFGKQLKVVDIDESEEIK